MFYVQLVILIERVESLKLLFLNQPVAVIAVEYGIYMQCFGVAKINILFILDSWYTV